MLDQSHTPIDDQTSRSNGENTGALSLSRVVATLQVVLATRRAARAARAAEHAARSPARAA
jgi:hypothetical protein